MTACLHDPQDGYYATRPAPGRERRLHHRALVSQMFGELIGLWARRDLDAGWDAGPRPCWSRWAPATGP